MPTLQQAQQLKDFTEEIFSISKDFWGVQSRSKGRQQAEITETEFLTLDLLIHSDTPLTVGDIQRHIGVLPAQMSRVIRSLESKTDAPLISCQINPQDKRKINVSLTDAGRKAHQDYRKMKFGGIEKMLMGMTEHDRTELLRLMRIIRDVMTKS